MTWENICQWLIFKKKIIPLEGGGKKVDLANIFHMCLIVNNSLFSEMCLVYLIFSEGFENNK